MESTRNGPSVPWTSPEPTNSPRSLATWSRACCWKASNAGAVVTPAFCRVTPSEAATTAFRSVLALDQSTKSSTAGSRVRRRVRATPADDSLSAARCRQAKPTNDRRPEGSDRICYLPLAPCWLWTDHIPSPHVGLTSNRPFHRGGELRHDVARPKSVTREVPVLFP